MNHSIKLVKVQEQISNKNGLDGSHDALWTLGEQDGGNATAETLGVDMHHSSSPYRLV